MGISIIIPTYNRKEALERCIDSILLQTRMPLELIVVDDGKLGDIPCRRRLEAKGVSCFLRRKDRTEKQGLTISKNIGVGISSGDIILFLDDDVRLESDYLQVVTQFFQSKFDPGVGGMAGQINGSGKGLSLYRYAEFLFNVLFLISPLRQGRLTATGYCEQNLLFQAFPVKKICQARIIGGGISAFKRRVFDSFAFSEDYEKPNCRGEDKDFSLRVSSTYTLYIVPQARLFHDHIELERAPRFDRGKDLIFSAYRLFSRYIRRHRWQNILFYYSTLGIVIRSLALWIVSVCDGDEELNEWLRVKGTLYALGQVILRGKI